MCYVYLPHCDTKTTKNINDMSSRQHALVPHITLTARTQSNTTHLASRNNRCVRLRIWGIFARNDECILNVIMMGWWSQHKHVHKCKSTCICQFIYINMYWFPNSAMHLCYFSNRILARTLSSSSRLLTTPSTPSTASSRSPPSWGHYSIVGVFHWIKFLVVRVW